MPQSHAVDHPNSGYYLVIHSDTGLVTVDFDAVIPAGASFTLASLATIGGGLTLLDGAQLVAPKLATVKNGVKLGKGSVLSAPLLPQPSRSTKSPGIADAPLATNRQDVADGFHLR